MTALTAHASASACSQSLKKRTRLRRRSRSRGGTQGQLDAARASVRLWLEPTLECSPFCQGPLTSLLSDHSRPTPRSQYWGQRVRGRGRLRARSRAQGDSDHHPRVRRRPERSSLTYQRPLTQLCLPPPGSVATVLAGVFVTDVLNGLPPQRASLRCARGSREVL